MMRHECLGIFRPEKIHQKKMNCMKEPAADVALFVTNRGISVKEVDRGKSCDINMLLATFWASDKTRHR